MSLADMKYDGGVKQILHRMVFSVVASIVFSIVKNSKFYFN